LANALGVSFFGKRRAIGGNRGAFSMTYLIAIAKWQFKCATRGRTPLFSSRDLQVVENRLGRGTNFVDLRVDPHAGCPWNAQNWLLRASDHLGGAEGHPAISWRLNRL
jgi:hypothetical protein